MASVDHKPLPQNFLIHCHLLFKSICVYYSRCPVFVEARELFHLLLFELFSQFSLLFQEVLLRHLPVFLYNVRVSLCLELEIFFYFFFSHFSCFDIEIFDYFACFTVSKRICSRSHIILRSRKFLCWVWFWSSKVLEQCGLERFFITFIGFLVLFLLLLTIVCSSKEPLFWVHSRWAFIDHHDYWFLISTLADLPL